jgi:hypothetical protein
MPDVPDLDAEIDPAEIPEDVPYVDDGDEEGAAAARLEDLEDADDQDDTA